MRRYTEGQERHGHEEATAGQPLEFRCGADTRAFRAVMGSFATGITVVTAMTADGDPIGLTANSISSVSLEPPLLLVCIGNEAGSAEVLRAAPYFGVNVLRACQQDISNCFANRRIDRFANTSWTCGGTGVPLLNGALSSFECRQYALHEAGDHFILVGQVERAQCDPSGDPLLYFRGQYQRPSRT